MKRTALITTIAILGLVSTNALTVRQNIKPKENDEQVLEAFTEFTSRFSRQYKTLGEYNKRLSTFKKSFTYVENHNKNKAEKAGYTLEINKFADMTKEEYESLLGFKKQEVLSTDGDDEEVLAETEEFSEQTLPTSFDWRLKGKMTFIRNQRYCGSCYAFAALNTIETSYYIRTNNSINLSEQ